MMQPRALYLAIALSLLIGSLALKLVKDYLAQTYMIGGYFYIFVALDILQSFLKREYYGRYDTCLVVSTRSTHIRELLRLGDVYHDIVVLGVLAHYLTGINFLLGEDEESAAVLKFVNSVGVSCAALHGYE